LPVLAGQALLHYRLVEKIGAGGMGEVWRAVDTRLGREVAVKVITDRLAEDPNALARFEREARAVAALSHPNVIALYDVGREDGVPYVVTELLRGTTLRQRLATSSLAPRAAVEFAIQVAEGLAAAHARGLIHRDLKPENVFVADDGGVKILDFGLARFTDGGPDAPADENAPTAAMATRTGMILGSPGYMSPEQIRGQTVDARADLFSFGAVLYEMVSGRRAFDGPSTADVLSAVLHEEPPRVQDPSLDRILRKCLMKSCEQRYATAREVIQELQAVLAGVVTTEGEPAIAVLPFVDMSQSKDQDYFCEGMTEEIISALSVIPGLHVAARTSTFQFKGTHQDVRHIGQTLGVNKVLEGSVRTAGDRLRVTAQLINVSDGYRVWSERYDRQMEDVFAIQDEIARSVAQALAGQLEARHAPGAARKHTDDLEAYHLYLKGRHERYRTRNFDAALRRFEEASERDPRYALARLGIAEACVLLGNTGMTRPRVTVARAETELEYANALADESAESRAVECALRMAKWEFAAGEAAGRRAIELDPNYVFGWTWLSIVLAGMGEFDEAHAIAQRAVPIDPQSPLAWTIDGWVLSAGRRFTEAEPPLRRALELNPTHDLALWNLGIALVGLGRHEEAIALLERAHAGSRPGASLILGILAWGKAVSGRFEEARRHLDELNDWARHRYVPRYPMAWTLAALGDIGEALDLYERSVEERDAFLQYALLPGYDPLRAEPRFQRGLRSIGVAWAIGS
jgi:serine/threonine protein kinase/tetratricopeptide (TPR) repeat protein